MNSFQSIQELVGAAAEWVGVKISRVDQIDGVVICDLTPAQPSKDAFLELTRQAMALIQSLDSRRYHRVCRCLRYIANTGLLSKGQFGRVLKICRVDYDKNFNSQYRQKSIHEYACLLIHEATHGFLFEKGIPYDKDTRERVERLCHLESYRFALHFEAGYADLYLGPYDPKWHKRIWGMSPPVRRAAVWKRLQEALKSSFPKNARDYQLRSRAFTRKGEYDKALTDADNALRLDPEFAEAYFSRGTAHLRQRNYDKAIIDYDHGIQLSPRDARAYVNRGMAHFQKRDYDKAVADNDQAIQLNPKLAAAYMNRGVAYIRKLDYDRAVADYDHAIQLKPREAASYVNRGTAYLKKLDYEKAIADYEYAIQYNPWSPAVYKNLAWLLATCPRVSLRDGEKAVQHATKACVLLDWKDPGALRTLGATCAEAGEFDDAAKWQSQYLETAKLSSIEIAKAKSVLELYRAHKPYSEE